jgi:hypothetical protein
MGARHSRLSCAFAASRNGGWTALFSRQCSQIPVSLTKNSRFSYKGKCWTNVRKSGTISANATREKGRNAENSRFFSLSTGICWRADRFVRTASATRKSLRTAPGSGRSRLPRGRRPRRSRNLQPPPKLRLPPAARNSRGAASKSQPGAAPECPSTRVRCKRLRPALDRRSGRLDGRFVRIARAAAHQDQEPANEWHRRAVPQDGAR